MLQCMDSSTTIAAAASDHPQITQPPPSTSLGSNLLHSADDDDEEEVIFFDSQEGWLDSASDDDFCTVYAEPLTTRTSSITSASSSSSLSIDFIDNSNSCDSKHETSSSDDAENELFEDHFWGDQLVKTQTGIDVAPAVLVPVPVSDYYNTSKERRFGWSDNKQLVATSCSGEFLNLHPQNATQTNSETNGARAPIKQDRTAMGTQTNPETDGASRRCCSCFSF